MKHVITKVWFVGAAATASIHSNFAVQAVSSREVGAIVGGLRNVGKVLVLPIALGSFKSVLIPCFPGLGWVRLVRLPGSQAFLAGVTSWGRVQEFAQPRFLLPCRRL